VADGSDIEWTDATWNPVRGCTKVSSGCKHCYAERFAERFRGVPGHPFERGFDVRLVPEALSLPIHWRRPRRVFVNSMSDLFHEAVPFYFIDMVFGVMAACEVTTNYGEGHTFQVLTKRPERMREYLSTDRRRAWAKSAVDRGGGENPDPLYDQIAYRDGPLPNVWLGVSVEDQAAADQRIPLLRETPAAVRFLSCEPLLGPVDLRMVTRRTFGLPSGGRGLAGELGWVIVGGESGPGVRPCDVDWVRSLVEQCRAAGVPAFVKQLGARAQAGYYDDAWRGLYEQGGFEWPEPEGWDPRDGQPQVDAKVRLRFSDRKGGDPAEWPEDLRVREMPGVSR
jgi:protein gp37